MNKKNVIIILLIIAIILAITTIVLNLTFDANSKLEDNSQSGGDINNPEGAGQIGITITPPETT